MTRASGMEIEVVGSGALLLESVYSSSNSSSLPSVPRQDQSYM